MTQDTIGREPEEQAATLDLDITDDDVTAVKGGTAPTGPIPLPYPNTPRARSSNS